MGRVVIGFRGKCKRAAFFILQGSEKWPNSLLHKPGCALIQSPLIRNPTKPTNFMSDKSIEEKVKDIIVEQLGVNPEQVTPQASFIEDLGADSLDTVELVMAFEEEFNVEVPDEDAEKLQTVGDVVTYITEKTAK